MMTLQESIVARHSVRAYKDQPMSEELVHYRTHECGLCSRRANIQKALEGVAEIVLQPSTGMIKDRRSAG